MHHWFKNKIISEDVTALGIKPNPVNVDVYHGSGYKFDKFDQGKARIANDHMGGGVGYFTSDKGVAGTYAKSMARKAGTKTPHIYHTNLKMNNVFDVDHKFSGDKLKHVLPDDVEGFARGAGLLKPGTDKYKVINDLKDGTTELHGHEVFKGLSRGGVDTLKAREHLVKKGFDGMRYNGGVNMNAATKHDVYMPYAQKSITLNKREAVGNPASVQEEYIFEGEPFLRSAIKWGGKIHQGKEGEIHTDILKRLPKEAENDYRKDDDTSNYNGGHQKMAGFINHKGHFLDRKKAAEYAHHHDLVDHKYYIVPGREKELPSEALKSVQSKQVREEKKEQGMKNTYGLPKSLIEAASKIGEASGTKRELDLQAEQEFKLDNGYLSEAWKYHQYASSEEAHDARKKHFAYKNPDGTTCGNACRSMGNGKLAYMGEFKGPKPSKKIAEDVIVEEWSVLDNHTMKIVSKHGDHQAPALTACRTLNSKEFDSTKKKDRYRVVAPGTAGHGVKAATAKKINGGKLPYREVEESEQLDELSKGVLKNYGRAARKQINEPFTDKKTIEKRHAGHLTSVLKKNGSPLVKVNASESEQIDELSKDKLDQYVEKATDDAIDHVAKGRNNNKTGIKHFEKATSRYKGVRLARHKIDVKEEEQLDELSRKTLLSYKEKSRAEQDEIGARHDDNVLKINYSDDSRKFHNRSGGESNAWAKTTPYKFKKGQGPKVRATTVAQDNARRKAAATNEEEQIEELSHNLLKRYEKKATYSGRANYIKGTFSDNDDEAKKNITLAHRRDEGIKKAKQKLSESIMQNLKDILNK